MPLKLAKSYSKELDLVLEIFNKTRPPGLLPLKIVKEKEKELSTAAALAVDAVDVVAGAAPAGIWKAGVKLAGFFIARGTKKTPSVTYTDLDYFHEKMEYQSDEAKTQALTKKVHDELYRYSGKKSYDEILTDHRTAVMVLLEYLNKGIATHPNKRQLYIQYMTDFIAAIFANDKKAQREVAKHRQIFLLDSKSADGSRLEDTLHRISDDFLYPFIDDAKKASVSDRLAETIKQSAPKLKQTLEELDHRFLTLMTGFSQIPINFIRSAAQDDNVVHSDSRYSNIKKILAIEIIFSLYLLSLTKCRTG